MSDLDWRTRGLVGTSAALLRALAATWRFERINDAPVRALRAARRPILFAFWHAQQLPLLLVHRGEGAAVLISEHRDGEVVARVATGLGFTTLRGSSTHGAASALRAMGRALRAGRDVGVTPDGPRGPARRFSPGPLVAAYHADAFVVLVGVAVDRAWRLRSWDQFVVPKPFARVVVAYSEPQQLRSRSARAAAEEATRFGDQLDATMAVAERALARRQHPRRDGPSDAR